MPAISLHTSRLGQSRWRRFVLFTVAALICVILVGIAGGYLWLRRSLPATSGELLITGLQQPVTVYRDARGVPHIFAENSPDLFFAQGYVTAQDRLWQMDLTRRVPAGRLAEIFGADLVETDRFFRTLGLQRAAAASLPEFTPETRAILEAYAAGVNTFIDQSSGAGRLPVEFQLLGYAPEPWQPLDTVMISKMMAYELGGNFQAELWRYELARRVGLERTMELAPIYPKGVSPSIPEVLEHEIDVEGLPAALLTSTEGLGSNAWVLAGDLTDSGAPLLANDPHLAIRMPSIWYQTHLHAPEGWDVIGATFPGAPGIVLGHNRDIAWGFTNLGPDVQDLYMIIPNPENPHEYLYEDEWEQAEVLTEEIKVKGRQQPLRHEVVITRHGPVITPVVGSQSQRPDAAFALRWTALDATTELDAILQINTAPDWESFRQALRHFQVPAQNILFAGADGTIAYRANGRIPIRPESDGLFPVPGWTGQHEWLGYIPWEELPEAVNPEQGFLFSANARVVGDDYPYFITHEWPPPQRHNRIEQVLLQADAWTARDAMALQLDTANLQADDLLPLMLPAARRGLNRAGGPSPVERQALDILAAWDHHDQAAATGPAIFYAWYGKLQQALFEEEMGSELLRRMPAPTLVMDRLLHEAAAGRPASWFNNPATSEPEGLDEVAARSFRTAVAWLVENLGNNPARWEWGQLHTVSFSHPMDSVPLLDRLLSIGPLPLGGSHNTVAAAAFGRTDFTVRAAAPWRQVVDLANPQEHAFDVMTPGQSAHRLSPYYADQLDLWIRGEYKPKLISAEDLAGSRRLVLRPPQ